MRQWSGRASTIILLLATLTMGCSASSFEGEGPKQSGDDELAEAQPGDGGDTTAASSSPDIAASGPKESAPVEPEIPSGPRLFAYDGYEKIFLKPDKDSPPIGLVRAGQSVPLVSAEPVKGPGVNHCSSGAFYAVKPRGYICSGRNSTTDGKDARVRAAAEILPPTNAVTPYRMGVLIADSPIYKRIPTAEEQRKNEPGLDDHLKQFAAGTLKLAPGSGKLDYSKAGNGPSAAFVKYTEAVKLPLLADQDGYLGRKMAFAKEFDAEGRTFLVTPDLTLVPKDKVRFVETPQLKGVDLTKGELEFPFGYSWIQDAPKLKRNEDGTFIETGDVYARQAFVQIEGPLIRGAKGGNFWKTADGTYVRHELLSIFKKRDDRPKGVGPKDKWVDVRVTWGTLVAYEGDTPVYATAVSPGQDGITASRNSHNTVMGQYSVGWKLYAADMSGVEKSKPWAVDEVPFVAYFKDSYAVHGAWWHNDFGRPKSHGCVNVAPNDAHFLWNWMDPVMPEGWYAVASYRPEQKQTTVIVLRP